MSKLTIGGELAKDVADKINNGSEFTKDFIGEMSHQHRTLQQGFTRICAAWLQHCGELEAKGSGWYDLRNEASVKLGAEFLRIDPRKRAIPYI